MGRWPKWQSKCHQKIDSYYKYKDVHKKHRKLKRTFIDNENKIYYYKSRKLSNT